MGPMQVQIFSLIIMRTRDRKGPEIWLPSRVYKSNIVFSISLAIISSK